MRRTALSTSLVVALGAAAIGAQTCTPTGPAARAFASGSLVIPMDNCHQWRDGSKPAGCVGGSAAADDGVLRAYGVVYFLLEHGVTVYWAIDGATPKATVTAPDVTVPASAPAAVQRMSWASGAFTNLADTAGGVSYVGGPFLVAAEDTARVVKMLTDPSDPAHADFARFRAEAAVDVHRLQVAADVQVSQVRPLTGPPPKIAILNVTPPAGKKTSSNVMYQYAVAAGLSWPCAGNGDCAGGLGAGCNKTAVLAYLANPVGDRPDPPGVQRRAVRAQLQHRPRARLRRAVRRRLHPARRGQGLRRHAAGPGRLQAALGARTGTRAASPPPAPPGRPCRRCQPPPPPTSSPGSSAPSTPSSRRATTSSPSAWPSRPWRGWRARTT